MKREMKWEDTRIQVRVKLLNLSLFLIFHSKKWSPFLPSATPLLCQGSLLNTLWDNSIIADHTGSSPWCAMFAFPWDTRRERHCSRTAPLTVDFIDWPCHSGGRSSFSSYSCCLSVKTGPISGHRLSCLTDPPCLREEHLGHFSLEH